LAMADIVEWNIRMSLKSIFDIPISLAMTPEHDSLRGHD